MCQSSNSDKLQRCSYYCSCSEPKMRHAHYESPSRGRDRPAEVGDEAPLGAVIGAEPVPVRVRVVPDGRAVDEELFVASVAHLLDLSKEVIDLADAGDVAHLEPMALEHATELR